MRASETDRALLCPASLVLPRVARAPNEKRDRAASYGTLAHHWAETGEIAPPWADPRDVDVLEKKLLLTGIKREDWWPHGHHEVSFAIRLADVHNQPELLLMVRKDPTEIRPGVAYRCNGLDDMNEWKRSFDSRWLTGTIDLLDWGDVEHKSAGNPTGTTAWVDDLKTGRWPVDATTSGQLRSYALVPWLAAGKPMAWDGLVSITQWPKYPLAALPVRNSHHLTALDLMEHLGDLQHAASHPRQVVPGDDQCRFCDCKRVCPAWVGEDDEQGARE